MEFLLIKQPRVIPRQISISERQAGHGYPALPADPAACLAHHADLRPGHLPGLARSGALHSGADRKRGPEISDLQVPHPDTPGWTIGQCQAYMKAYVKGEVTCLEEGQEVFKPIQPAQITRVGRLLRKTSLDELPQLINIFKGEMSIVGPRPNVPWEVEAYHPWHHERLEVLPGVTGLAQVHGRSCIDFNTLVRYDVQYIETCSLALDIKILWWTFTAIIQGKGRCNPMLDAGQSGLIRYEA